MLPTKHSFIAAVVAVFALSVGTVAFAQGDAAPASGATVTNGPGYKEMGWGGLGVRIGYTMPRLKASKLKSVPVVGDKLQQAIDNTNTKVKAYNDGVDAHNAMYPGSPMAKLPLYSISDMDIGGRVLEVTPVIHLGGDGYFWKFEFPFCLSPEFSSYGLGIYPINYGYYVDSIGLFPYLSLGFAVSYATATKFSANGSEVEMKAAGVLAQARAALGVKFYVTSFLPMSVELGYSPYAAGGVADTKAINALNSTTAPGSTADIANIPHSPGSLAKGGIGTMWNLTFGAEWL